MKFHGAHGNAQTIGDLLVDAVAEQLDQDLVFAGAERHGREEATPKAKKLFGFPGYLGNQVVVRGDADRVVGGRISPHGAGERQESGGALDRGGFISLDLDIEAGNPGMPVANEQHARRLRERSAPAG